MNNSKKVLLVILDGWGIGKDSNVSAVELSKTPNIDDLFRKYNYSTLRTDGEYVGLPKGQMGNSEVGHINIGAGRIVHQDLAKINISIQNNKFAKNKTLINGLNFAKKTINLFTILVYYLMEESILIFLILRN